MNDRRRLLCLLISLITIFSLSNKVTSKGQNPARVPMESFKALYFKDGHKTMSRRGKPFPQLQCIGNSKHICQTYSPDIVLCKHQGDGAWKCEADLHHSVRFGTVDVSCEGWDGPKDDYVLRGSCMLSYTLLPNYPDSRGSSSDYNGQGSNKDILIVIGIILVVFFFFFWNGRNDRGNQGRGGTWRGGGGGGGGGGPNDPPPPYRPYPKQEPGTSSSNTSSTENATGWRPGFWTGLLGGYMANETARYMRGGNTTDDRRYQRRTWFDGGRDDYDPFQRGGGNAFGAAGPSRSRSDDGETRTAFGYGGSSVR